MKISPELRKRLAEALQRSYCQSEDTHRGSIIDYQVMEEMRSLCMRIHEGTNNLREVFWSEKELKEIRYAKEFYDARMEAMVHSTLANLEWYRNEGWKDFLG